MPRPTRPSVKISLKPLGRRLQKGEKLSPFNSPFLQIMQGADWIWGVHHHIQNPAQFKGLFPRGAHVFKLHFNSIDRGIMALMLRKLGESIPLLSSSGLAGAFTDTPNANIANYLKKRLGGIEIPCPKKDAVEAQRAYNAKKTFPAEFRKGPVRRIVIVAQK